MLPEKKRARRRLVGAIALALAAAVGLPMLLDSEPKPLAGDIAIQIPAKDKAAPLPVPAAGKAVSAADSVDKDEEVVDAPPVEKAPKAPAVVAAAKPEATKPKPEPKAEHKPEPAKPEHKDVPKPEHKEAPKPEHKEPKPEVRLAEKDKPVKPKTDDKPAKSHDDAARALAILEGKQAEKDKQAESGSQRFVLQVAALSSQEKAAEVQAKLREAGISSYTQKTNTPSGELIRVRVGPLNKEDAEKVRAKLGRLGMSGAMTPV
jgi:DedD protein